MKEFFSKDPAKALVEIKEELYRRLVRSQQFIDQYGAHLNVGRVVGEDPDQDLLHREQVGFDRAVKDDIAFLKHILDVIERS
jgi:hypothetical protein